MRDKEVDQIAESNRVSIRRHLHFLALAPWTVEKDISSPGIPRVTTITTGVRWSPPPARWHDASRVAYRSDVMDTD